MDNRNSSAVETNPTAILPTSEVTTTSVGTDATNGNPIKPADVTSTSPSSSESTPPSASSGDQSDPCDTIECAIKKYHWLPPADAARIPYRPHQGEGSQYLRDFILGVNDGLISTFLLVVGVVGGGATQLQCLLAAISAGVAGAIAMGIGEYIATKAQLQVNDGEFKLEVEHFKYHRDVELQQLRSFLSSICLKGPLLEAVVSEVGRSDESLMKMMMAFEFGVHAEELERNPLKAMIMSGRLFLIGALPTVIPFFIPLIPGQSLGIAAALVGSTLFIVGAYKTRATKGNPWIDGFENFTLGAIATGISYAVGVAFEAASA